MAQIHLANSPFGGATLRFRGEPTSLLYASTVLVDRIRKGVFRGVTSVAEVRLWNPDFASESFFQSFAEAVHRDQPVLVGICNMTAAHSNARRLVELVRQASPGSFVVIGGPHEDDVSPRALGRGKNHAERLGATSAQGEIRKSAALGVGDLSVFGDGEYLFPFVAQVAFDRGLRGKGLEPGGRAGILAEIASRADEVAGLPGHGGLCFCDPSTGAPVCLKSSQRRIDLDALPLLPRELVAPADSLSFTVFRRRGRLVRTAQILAHRGCRYQCSFCSETQEMSVRSVESVRREIAASLDMGYGAVFFDDSTFTATDRDKRTKEYLNELLGMLSDFKSLHGADFEWGCQTRVDCVDPELLNRMAAAGCTYIYFGVESGSAEMLKDMRKDQRRIVTQRAFAAVAQTPIRVGISLVFGVCEPGSDTTAENEATVSQTVGFVQKLARMGNLELVSINLATFYPGTDNTLGSLTARDFTRSIQNPGFPFSRFEDGEGHLAQNMTAEFAEFILKQCIIGFGEYLSHQDLYSIADIIEPYRRLEANVAADLNHASLTMPLPEAREAALRYFSLPSERGEHSRQLLARARRLAAECIGAESSESIVLTRNTTEALVLPFWLTNLHQAAHPRAVITRYENLATRRALQIMRDPGNPDGRDAWSSFQDFGTAMGTVVPASPPKGTGMEVVVVDFDPERDEESLAKVLAGAAGIRNRCPSLVIVSHVIRDNGTILDVGHITRQIRRRCPDAWIVVDGAQAVGGLRRVDVQAIGCDFYAFSPHKTLGAFPLGVLYISPRALEFARSGAGLPLAGRPILLRGMTPASMHLHPTVPRSLSLPEVASFVAGIEAYREKFGARLNDFASAAAVSSLRKRYFVNRLRRIDNDVEDQEIPRLNFSPFIYSFRFRGRDNRTIAEHVWRDERVLVSYIARSDLIRVSFRPSTTEDELERAIAGFDKVLHGSNVLSARTLDPEAR